MADEMRMVSEVFQLQGLETPYPMCLGAAIERAGLLEPSALVNVLASALPVLMDSTTFLAHMGDEFHERLCCRVCGYMHEHRTLMLPFPKRPQCPDCGIELAVISEGNYLLPKTSQTEEARVASAFDLASIMLAKHEIAMLLASDIVIILD